MVFIAAARLIELISHVRSKTLYKKVMKQVRQVELFSKSLVIKRINKASGFPTMLKEHFKDKFRRGLFNAAQFPQYSIAM
jgi:hypothetical protein